MNCPICKKDSIYECDQGHYGGCSTPNCPGPDSHCDACGKPGYECGSMYYDLDAGKPGTCECACHTEEKDITIQYFVVKKSLNMSAGKVAAQCAHASRTFGIKYAGRCAIQALERYTDDEMGVAYNWLTRTPTVVILGADDKEFEKVKEAFPNGIVITDAGRTEVERGSETVIALWPMLKSEAPKFIRRIRLL